MSLPRLPRPAPVLAFGALVRLLATGVGRPLRVPRASIRLALSATVTVVLSMTGLVPAASAQPSESLDLLFVQTAHRATLTLKHGVGTLKLHRIGPVTIYFSDRPERVTGRWSNATWVRNWTKGGKNSFANDPPNAAIDAELDGEDVTVLLELIHPRLRGRTLTYRVKLLQTPTVGLSHVAHRLEAAYAKLDRYISRGRSIDLAHVSVFIDDYATNPPATSYTGFFGHSIPAAVGTVIRNVPISSSLTVNCMTVTASTNGVLTGTAVLGVGSATAPMTATGTFTWTNSNDWSISVGVSSGAPAGSGGAEDACGSTTSGSDPPVLSGTITDTAATGLGGALTINTTVGAAKTPVSLSLSYSGKTASFSGTVDGAKLPSGATASLDLTATKGVGLSGSVQLTDATLGQTQFPTLSLTFDTSTASVAVAGEMKTDMGNFAMSASWAHDRFDSLSVSGDDLSTVGGDKQGSTSGEFAFTSFSFSVTNIPTTGCISFMTSNVQGNVEMGHDKFQFGPNSLTFNCGKVTNFVMNLSGSHTSGPETVTIAGNLTYAAPSSTVSTLTGYGWLPTINYTAGFFGSLSFDKYIRVSASKKVAGYNIKGSFGIDGSVGFQVGIYQNQSSRWNYAVGFFGHLDGSAKIKKLHVDGSVDLGCSWLSSGSDFSCSGDVHWDLAGKRGGFHVDGI